MTYLSVQGLRKEFGAFKAIDDVSLSLGRGRVCALVGPSGCGKTTTLRSIAGLETPDTGRIELDGRILFDGQAGIVVPPEERNLGMVFQSYALWPHKTIGENVALGLRIKGMGRADIRERVGSVLTLVGMGGMEERYPASLSGGQQQRVALARALALRPKCILFDEPLSNLDVLLRERMRFEIRDLLVKLDITAVYVTHDQTEAMVIADHMIVLNAGRIEQEGAPADIYARPRNRFTAEFLGRTNLLALDHATSDLATGSLRSRSGVALQTSDRDPRRSGDLLIAFRPESVRVDEAPGPNSFATRVISAQFLGSQTQLTLDLDGEQIIALLPGKQLRAPEESLRISVAPQDVLVLEE